MSVIAPTATSPTQVDTSDWPESFVKNGYSEQRGGDDVLFTIAPEGHYLASLNCYAVIPVEKYFALINEPLPERVAQGIGCAVGDDGAIVFTGDGGLTWNIAPMPFPKARPPLASISFADESHAWAVGGNSDPMKPSLSAPSSVVVTTDNGGQTWRVVQL